MGESWTPQWEWNQVFRKEWAFSAPHVAPVTSMKDYSLANTISQRAEKVYLIFNREYNSTVSVLSYYYTIICPNSSAIRATEKSLSITSAKTAQFQDSMQYSVRTSRQPNNWSMSKLCSKYRNWMTLDHAASIQIMWHWCFCTASTLPWEHTHKPIHNPIRKYIFAHCGPFM